MASATRILGLTKLQRKMELMPSVAKARIRAALEKAAEDIVQMMKRLVPVDEGALRASIGWTWGKAPKGAMTIGKVAESALGGDLTITIYAGNDVAFHARWVEFGTQDMAAQPYFFPSYRANKKRAKSSVRRAISKAAKEVASS